MNSRIDKMIKELCPNGVEKVRLEDVGSFYNGVTGKSKKDFEDGNAKFITYMNIFSNPTLKIDVSDKVVIKEGEKQNKIKYGDCLFTTSSETPEECGMSSVLTTHTEESLYLNSFCFGFRFNDLSGVEPSFMSHLFRSEALRAKISKTANGVTRYNISKKLFEKIEIPLPPLAIQQEIVNILDKFTSLIDKIDEEIELRQKQYEYYREKLLTSAKTIIKYLPQLSNNCDSMRKPITGSNRISGPYPYYGASGIVDYVDGYIYDGSYLLISEDGNNLIARSTPIAFSIDGKSWVNNHAHVLKFDNKYIQKYVEVYLNSVDLTPYITGGAQPKINQKNLNIIPIPMPNDADTEKIVSTLDKFESLISKLKETRSLRQKQYEYYREKLLTFA